jgi:hypothetical protein
MEGFSYAAEMSEQSREGRQAMVQHVAELTRTLLECEYVSVVLVEPERDQLRLVSIAGASKEQEQDWSTAITNLCLHETLDAGSFLRLREGEVLQVAQAQPLLQAMCSISAQKVLIAVMATWHICL